jgi:hypothetical protein
MEAGSAVGGLIKPTWGSVGTEFIVKRISMWDERLIAAEFMMKEVGLDVNKGAANASRSLTGQ